MLVCCINTAIPKKH
ncbi:MAG: hypothetical protein E7638_04670 [Ruminococcaceae bacterium]|nr:hypothetical protein [Oscillospiraceae bacterium]